MSETLIQNFGKNGLSRTYNYKRQRFLWWVSRKQTFAVFDDRCSMSLFTTRQCNIWKSISIRRRNLEVQIFHSLTSTCSLWCDQKIPVGSQTTHFLFFIFSFFHAELFESIFSPDFPENFGRFSFGNVLPYGVHCVSKDVSPTFWRLSNITIDKTFQARSRIWTIVSLNDSIWYCVNLMTEVCARKRHTISRFCVWQVCWTSKP